MITTCQGEAKVGSILCGAWFAGMCMCKYMWAYVLQEQEELKNMEVEGNLPGEK